MAEEGTDDPVATAVLDANTAFYSAFSNGDIEAMAQLWVRPPHPLLVAAAALLPARRPLPTNRARSRLPRRPTSTPWCAYIRAGRRWGRPRRTWWSPGRGDHHPPLSHPPKPWAGLPLVIHHSVHHKLSKPAHKRNFERNKHNSPSMRTA